MAYSSEHSSWAEERERIAARKRKEERRAQERRAVEELETFSQRVVGRVLLFFRR